MTKEATTRNRTLPPQGVFTANWIPYGYKYNPDSIEMLEIDTEVSDAVIYLFSEAIQGRPIYEDNRVEIIWRTNLMRERIYQYLKRIHACQTAHCGRGKSHFIFVGLASPIVPYRNLKQTTDGITADCRSLV